MATKHSPSAGQGWQAVTQHPLFGTVVPVWLAATFALSTLAVRGELLERIVLSLQLDLILPMATPPLGTTARLMLAVAFGLMGALLGWVAVRKLAPRETYAQKAWQEAQREAAPLRRRSADAHPDFPARQPIQAHAELGEHGFDNHPVEKPAYEPAPQVNQQSTAPSYSPPPPVAETWQVLHDVPAPPPPAEEPSWDWKPQPVAVDPVIVEPVVVQAPVEVVPQRPVLTESVLAELTPAEPASAEPISQPFRFFQIDPVPAAPAAPEAAPVAMVTPVLTPAPIIEQPIIQPIVEIVPEIVAAPTIEPVIEQPAPTSKAVAGFPSITLDGPSAAEHIATASLESLSHVELLERLAQALHRHQSAPQSDTRSVAPEPALAPAPDGTGDALRAALASLRDVK